MKEKNRYGLTIKDAGRIPRKLKKQMKKENRYTTPTEWVENYSQFIDAVSGSLYSHYNL